MVLLDDLSKREAKSESKPEPPAVGHYAVKLDLKEEKVSLTAGQTKEYAVVVTNTGTEDDTIRIKGTSSTIPSFPIRPSGPSNCTALRTRSGTARSRRARRRRSD